MAGRQNMTVNLGRFTAELRKLLVAAFADATPGQKIVVVGIGFGSVLLAELIGAKAGLPGWGLLITFFLVMLLILAAALIPLIIEKKKQAVARCRDVPIFPPDNATRAAVRAGLEEI